MPDPRLRPPALRRVAALVLWTTAAVATAVLSWSSTQPLIAVPPAAPIGHAPAKPAVPSPSTEQAAPAAGVTGTTALPERPIDARVDAVPVASAAPPFSTWRVGSVDRARALECLTAAVYYEAASEGDAGQRAVAQVVLNRVRHPAFPPTVCGVVYQGSERRGCQFSFACDGSMARTLSRSDWARATRNAAAALAGGVYAPVGLATHYHTFAVTPAWNRSLVMTGAVGAHLFHRWRGWWGTIAAFRQIYAGGEPAPGPHFMTASPMVTETATVAPAMPTPIPGAPTSTAELAAPQPVVEDRLPPPPEVLERWRDAGKPLR